MTHASDDASFTDYFSARQAWLRKVAFMLCQDWHRADDLLQTTAIQLYVVWHRADKIDHLDSYVRRILVNAYLAEQRSPWWKRVIPQWDDKDDVAESADLAAALDLHTALTALPPRQRITLVLRYYEQLSVQETADMLQCSTGTVKSQTARALTSLRRTLDPTDDDRTQPTTVRLNGPAGLRAPHMEGIKR
ncbi:MAG TPA: SigE family RNA polymerase sigma factor [Actinospica sp.]|jgi:RNA polymerase sigma-70 factor (sigma-E family)|nr:SigE family RNA polymerase sigma factor [Actinospica sp.]